MDGPAKPDHDETNDFCIVLILKNDDLSQVYTPLNFKTFTYRLVYVILYIFVRGFCGNDPLE
jgi:hypothetical protein